MLLLPFLALFSDDMDHSLPGDVQTGGDENTGTLEKMIAASGSVEMDLNLKQLGSIRSDARTAKTGTLRFEMEQDSFFTVLVFNDELRGPLPGSARLIPQNSSALPARLNIPFRQLLIESKEWGSAYDLVVCDAKTGFIFFKSMANSSIITPRIIYSASTQHGC